VIRDLTASAWPTLSTLRLEAVAAPSLEITLLLLIGSLLHHDNYFLAPSSHRLPALPIPRKHACSFFTSQIAPFHKQRSFLKVPYRSLFLPSNYHGSSLGRITTCCSLEGKSCTFPLPRYQYMPFESQRRRVSRSARKGLGEKHELKRNTRLYIIIIYKSSLFLFTRTEARHHNTIPFA
jgi:hypothetical protein